MIRVRLQIPSPALRAGVRALLATDETLRVMDAELNEEAEAEVVVISASAAQVEGNASAGILLLSDGQVNVEEMKRRHYGWGILPLDSSAEELIAAIHAISQGLVVGAPSLLFAAEEGETPARGPLTEREVEVLGLLAKGLANKQIAASLGISEHTVKFHVSSIYAKLNATNRAEAVREGLRGGWIVL